MQDLRRRSFDRNDQGRNAYERSGPIDTKSLLAGVDEYLDTNTLQEAQAFGVRLARDADLWRLHEGTDAQAAEIARRYGVSRRWAEMACRLNRGRRHA